MILKRPRNFYFLIMSPADNPGFSRSSLLRKSMFTEQFEECFCYRQSRTRLHMSQVDASTRIRPCMLKEIS